MKAQRIDPKMIELKQELYSIKDLSELLRVKPRTVWIYINRFHLETIKIANRTLVTRAEVEKLLAGAEVKKY